MTDATGTVGPVTAARAAIAAVRALDDATAPRAALDGWHGWGPLAPAFAWHGKAPAWQDIATELRALVSADDWKAGGAATDTSYSTPPAVAAALWDIATRLGFAGGAVLELGCGAGHLITAVPAGLPVRWTAVESDPVTARIATARCPHAVIHATPLERTPLPRAAFDLVIGNVPFSPTTPYDPAAPAGLSLHNYFLWRGLEALRPGGLLVAVTSRHTMDAVKASDRRELAALGDLAGVIRLPSGTFGGTDAVADIIVLRRRTGSTRAGDRTWLEQPERLPDADTSISTYWRQHPGMVTGTMTARKAGPHGHAITVATPAAGLVPVLDALTAHLAREATAAGLAFQPAAAPAPDPGEDETVLASDGQHILHDDGSVTRQQGLRHVPVAAPTDELRLLIRLRDAATALFAAEADANVPVGGREAIRIRTAGLYREYAAQFGYLNRCEISEATGKDGRVTTRRTYPPMGGFRGDPGYPEALAVEEWDDDTLTGQPAAILLGPVGVTAARNITADTPAEALALCLDATGRVDLQVIATALATTPDQLPELLDGLIWDDPNTGEWLPAAEYLSGDVRGKHAAAVAAAELDPRFGRHATALAAVIPADLPPERITVQLGAAWIPPDVITSFTCHLLGLQRAGGQVAVTYTPVAAAWEVKTTTEARQARGPRAQWATTRITVPDLVEHCLNGTMPVITDKQPDGSTTRNEAETALAADKARAICERFTEWAWEHPGRATRLVRLFNDRHNSLVARTYDGGHLSFPGMSAAFTPWPWQRDMTWRAVCTPASLCGHPTGAGKTATAAMIALTLRRLGVSRKPAFIVPNHLLAQHAAEVRRLYPGARILAAAAGDLSPARRRGFAARCAAGDWDLILLTHEQFEALPVAAATEAAHLVGITKRIDEAITAATGKGRAVKQLARRRRVIVARHEELLDASRDHGVTFEQTGIDYLLYDEAHGAKNLETAARAEGFSVKGSKQATDLLMKLGHLMAVNPSGRAGTLFTATFMSNSLAELHTLFRFLCPGRLEEMGLDAFDAFAAAHISYKTAVEVAPDGSGFRTYRRPSTYVNMPALRGMLADVADIRTKRQISLPGPRVETEAVPVEVDGLEQFTASLVSRADKIRAGGIDPAVDNMFLICTHGRRAAVDPRLVAVDPVGPGKIDAVATNAARIWHANKDRAYPGGGQPGAFQLMFLDQGTPNATGGQAYGWLRDALIARGVPADRIAYVHDAASHADRRDLFAKCRDGRIAILIGSTEKCGTGVNIQHQLAAIHHVDAPWRPADVEQRDGRGDRPGNCNEVLHIYRYITVRSFDAYMWQALLRKLRWAEQLFAGDTDTIDADLPDSLLVLAYTELAAIASGQPLMRELAEVTAELTRLRILHAGHVRGQAEITAAIRDLEQTAAARDAEAGEWHAIGFVRGEVTQPGLMSAGRLYDGDAAAGRFAELASAARDSGQVRHLGGWRGVGLQITPVPGAVGRPPAMLISAATSHASTTPVTLTVTTPRAWQPSAAAAVLTEIDEWLAGAAEAGMAAERDSAVDRAEAQRLRAMTGQPSPHAPRIRDLAARRAQIEEAVNGLAAARDQAAA